MAPKAKATAEDARRGSQQEAPPDTSKGSTWSVDINDALRDTELPPDVLKAFKAKGNFWEDFGALCVAAGLVPHPCFSREPKLSEEDASRGTSGQPGVVTAALLAARSILFDQPSMQVAKHVLPTSLHLDTLMFSGCKLTVSQLGLLKAGLSDPASAVQTLHVDWNPVERVLPAEAAEGRFLREFCELLEDTFGDMAMFVRKLGYQVNELADPEALEVVCAKDVPVDLKVWVAAFEHIAADIPTEEVERAFKLLDVNLEGLVAVERLQEARSSAAASPDEDVPDEVCTAFAQFADANSTLENLSFRCNRLLRLEAQSIGASLGSCPHLRSLNLWGNRVCNSGAAALAKALEGTFVLQFLGLGKNLITHEGLQKICQSVGYTRIDSDKQAAEVQKTVQDAAKKRKEGKAVVKKDGRGRERFAPEPRYETCEEAQDPETGETYWLWGRNLALKTLALDSNPIADAAAVAQLRPLGPAGSFLVLRGTPCAKELAESAAAAEVSTGWTLVLK